MYSSTLCCISLALREDRYFIAGRAIAVSLVHGGPPPGFLSTTLFNCQVGGSESANPVLEDIADAKFNGKYTLFSFTLTKLHRA